jgi:hypothetical protein
MAMIRIDFHIGYVDDLALKDRAGGTQGPAEACRINTPSLLKGVGSVVVLGDEMEKLAIEPKKRAEDPVAQCHRASHDGVEDGLHIGWRAADDAQDLGSCCLASVSLT